MKPATKATPIKRAVRKPTNAKAMPAAADRVTVRLKPVLAEKLAEARREQGLSVTQVVEAALERHFQMTPRTPPMTLVEALKKHGLLGAVDMGPDASVRVKEGVGEYLDRKYPHH